MLAMVILRAQSTAHMGKVEKVPVATALEMATGVKSKDHHYTARKERAKDIENKTIAAESRKRLWQQRAQLTKSREMRRWVQPTCSYRKNVSIDSQDP